jgi:hypothetical protein
MNQKRSSDASCGANHELRPFGFKKEMQDEKASSNTKSRKYG